MKLDYMDKEHPYYELNCRMLRFRINDDSYETVITILDRDVFGMDEIKHLNNLRWSFETFFRLI